jgi:hypothetical protein
MEGIMAKDLPKNITKGSIPKEKSEAEKSKFYIDDYKLTKLLLKEQKEFQEGLRKTSSNELAKYFITILEHILTKHNFSGYSKNYKDEFRSKSYMLFVKHWHKFDPTRARLNYFQKNGELFYKEDVEELRGAFGWFSLFAQTASVDEIRRLNKIRDKLKEIVEEKNTELEGLDQSMYQD